MMEYVAIVLSAVSAVLGVAILVKLNGISQKIDAINPVVETASKKIDEVLDSNHKVASSILDTNSVIQETRSAIDTWHAKEEDLITKFAEAAKPAEKPAKSTAAKTTKKKTVAAPKVEE